MRFYEENILPRLVEITCANKGMDRIRRPALAGLSGVVLEVGFGSGANAPLYPPEVTKVYAVEPSMVSRQRSAERVARSSAEVEFVGVDGQQLPLEDACVDNALSTWTLCTIPDVEAALGEIRRVLKPGGGLYFLEHGLAEEEKVQKWQHRLTPLQRRVAGGCHLDRDIDDLVERSGLEIERLKRFTVTGPKTFGSMYCGVARKPATT